MKINRRMLMNKLQRILKINLNMLKQYLKMYIIDILTKLNFEVISFNSLNLN